MIISISSTLKPKKEVEKIRNLSEIQQEIAFYRV